jgi:hypothetical protein
MAAYILFIAKKWLVREVHRFELRLKAWIACARR